MSSCSGQLLITEEETEHMHSAALKLRCVTSDSPLRGSMHSRAGFQAETAYVTFPGFLGL